MAAADPNPGPDSIEAQPHTSWLRVRLLIYATVVLVVASVASPGFGDCEGCRLRGPMVLRADLDPAGRRNALDALTVDSLLPLIDEANAHAAQRRAEGDWLDRIASWFEPRGKAPWELIGFEVTSELERDRRRALDIVIVEAISRDGSRTAVREVVSEWGAGRAYIGSGDPWARFATQHAMETYLNSRSE